jgi:hypothetical protein
MSVASNLTKTQWLKRPGLFRCILVEAQYIEAGITKTLYLSNHAFRSLPTDSAPNIAYKNLLNVGSVLTFSQRMSVALFGKTDTSTSAIEFFLHPTLESLINNADFAGQQLKVFIGDPTWPRDNFIEKFVGLSKSIDPIDDNRARITFSDYSATLTTPVLSSLVSSGTNKDVFAPRCFGQCFNIEPVLLDAVTKTYQINDGAIQTVTEVRESGFVIAPVNYTVNLSAGTITINKNVTGRLTLDCQGHVEAGTYLSTAEQIINYLLSLANQSNALDSNVLPTYTLGLYIKSQRNIDDCIDEICKSVGGNWYFDALSQLRLQHYNGVALTATSTVNAGQIKQASLRIKERFAAVKQLSLGYQKNFTPQKEGLAAAITENNPELAVLYQNNESVVNGTNVVSNISAAINSKLSTLIANLTDAQTELNRRLTLIKNPRTIYECETTLKTHIQGETTTVTYPKYFAAGKNAVVVGHVHRLNNPTDIIEVLA